METWKLLLITLLSAVVLGSIIGVATGKAQVKKARGGYHPLLSVKERVIYTALVLFGAGCIAVGVFVVPGLTAADAGVIYDEFGNPIPGDMAGGMEGGFVEGMPGDVMVNNATPEEAAAEEAADGEITDGEAVDGEPTEGEAAGGETAEGEAVEGETAEGEAVEGETAEGETTEGEATEDETDEEDATDETVEAATEAAAAAAAPAPAPAARPARRASGGSARARIVVRG